MLSLRGIPAVYFHSLLATPNDHEGVRRTGRARSINRRKFAWPELQSLVRSPSTAQQVLDEFRRLLTIRIEQPAFHPDATQEVLDLGAASLIAFLRSSPADNQKMLVVANVSGQAEEIDLGRHLLVASANELIAGTPCDQWKGRASLAPYQVIWLPLEAAPSR